MWVMRFLIKILKWLAMWASALLPQASNLPFTATVFSKEDSMFKQQQPPHLLSPLLLWVWAHPLFLLVFINSALRATLYWKEVCRLALTPQAPLAMSEPARFIRILKLLLWV